MLKENKKMNSNNNINSLTSADFNNRNNNPSKNEAFMGCAFFIIVCLGFYFVFFKNDDTVPDFVGTTVGNHQTIAMSNDVTVINESSRKNNSWTICYQKPEAGEKLEKNTVVKIYSAPDCNMMEDNGDIKFTLDNVIGKVVSEFDTYYYNTVPYDLNVTKVDVTGTNRSIWNSDNWIVCTQSIPENTKISKNDALTIEYGRDFIECETRQVEDGLTGNVEVDNGVVPDQNSPASELVEQPIDVPLVEDVSLQTSTVYSLCKEKFETYYPDLKAHWIIGVRYNEMSSENLMFDIPWDNFIQLNVDIKGTETVEYMCRVSGDENTPMIVEDKIIS